MMLKNYMEQVVLNLIDKVTVDMDLCRCRRCTTDIAAISLNDLPTKYVVTEKGELYSKLENFQIQVEVDVISAITKAAMIVKRNPLH